MTADVDDFIALKKVIKSIEQEADIEQYSKCNVII